MSVSRSLTWLGILILGALVTKSDAHFGSCEDHTPDCTKWRTWGFCDTNLRFMALNCPVSCNVCLDPGCFDRNQQCTNWARLGVCRQHPDEMRRLCPHSCNLCRIPEIFAQRVSSQNIAAPNFECGKPLANPNTGRRTVRQIIFPDELEEFLRTNKLKILKNGGVAMMRQGSSVSSPAAIRIDGVNVNDAFCGATLIHERFLVTAAHCVLNPDTPVRTVRLGELDFSRDNEQNSKPVDYKVKQIIVHPEFRPDSLERYNDMALIETEQKVQFNDVVYPFCLSNTRPQPTSVVIGSGFGFVNNTDRSTILQEAELKVVDSKECEAKYESEGLGASIRIQYPEFLQGKDILCAAFPGRSACKGDSGGPLFFENNSGQRFLVGVVGQGITCRGNGVSTLPGLYISVADHIDFINSVVYAE